MASPISSRKPRLLKVLTVAPVVLVIIALGIALKVSTEVREVRSADGGVVRLESYAFRTGNVRYEIPHRPAARAIAKVLPQDTRKKVRWLRPEVTLFATPSFANEPFLSAAFSASLSRCEATRLADASGLCGFYPDSMD